MLSNRLIEKLKIHVSDLKGRRSDLKLIYGVNGIPDNILIGRDSKIVARCLRGDDLDGQLALMTEDMS